MIGRGADDRTDGQWLAVSAAVVYTLVLLVAPLLVLAVRSVRPTAGGGWTLRAIAGWPTT